MASIRAARITPVNAFLEVDVDVIADSLCRIVQDGKFEVFHLHDTRWRDVAQPASNEPWTCKSLLCSSLPGWIALQDYFIDWTIKRMRAREIADAHQEFPDEWVSKMKDTNHLMSQLIFFTFKSIASI
jgi:hypothetical protein